jgi:hypothetical protein
VRHADESVAGLSLLIGWSLRSLADGRAARAWAGRHRPDPALLTAANVGAVVAAIWLWAARPLFHGLLMPFYQWPLATWMPVVLGTLFTASCVPIGIAIGRDRSSSLRAGIVWRVPVTAGLWLVLMALLPGWQGRALYEATAYAPGGLPFTTQPRLLPTAGRSVRAGRVATQRASGRRPGHGRTGVVGGAGAWPSAPQIVGWGRDPAA